MMRFAPMLLIGAVLSGCVVKNYHYGSHAPASAIASSQRDGQARVVVIRPGGYGHGVPFPVMVNGEEIATLRAQHYLVAAVPSGPVEVVARGEVTSAVTFEAEADRAYYIRAMHKAGWVRPRVQLKVVLPSEGEREARQCARAR